MRAGLGRAVVLAGITYLVLPATCLGRFRPGSIVAWGPSSVYGETNVPAGLYPVFDMAAGATHCVALRADGRIVGWGDNTANAAFNALGLTDVVALSAGRNFTVALRRNGAVAAWGVNNNKQSQYPQGIYDFKAISAGDFHSLALRAGGGVVAWGDNSSYECNVPGTLSTAAGVAAGWEYSLAIKADGTVTAWGYSGQGVLSIPSGLNSVTAIAAGDFQNLALRSDGTVIGWPGTVPTGLSNVVAVAAGWGGRLALKSDGTVVAWGGAPAPPAGLSNVVKIAVGGYACFALIAPGPAITSKPAASVSVGVGQTASLGVTVLSSNAYSSQWFFNGHALNGATTTNLSVNDFDLSKAGIYSILISNQFGTDTATSVVRVANSPVVLVDGSDVGWGIADRVDSSFIGMNSEWVGAHIYFTLDGSAPNFTATAYSGDFAVTNSVTIRAIAYNSDYTSSAEAAPVSVQIWPTYGLTVGTAGGGSIDASPSTYGGGSLYVSNTLVTLTAVPDPGWVFLYWSGDSTSTSNVISLVVDRPRSVQAVFGVSLSVSTNGSGGVALSPSVGPYPYGSSVRLTALPSAGAYFFGWAGGVSGFGNPFVLTVTNAAGVTALFGGLNANQVSLTVVPEVGGSVSVSPSANVYTNGQVVVLAAVPEPGCVFKGWGGDASGSFNPAAVVLSGSKLITASFGAGMSTNPPIITRQPLSRTLRAGSDTSLDFQVTGDGPFSYQWRFGGWPLGGATNSILVLSHVTAAEAGLYDVAVTGVAGTARSSAASVAILGMELASSGIGRVPLLTLDGAVGTSYRLEFAVDAGATNWGLLAPVVLQKRSLYYVDDAVTNHSARFYRAVPQ